MQIEEMEKRLESEPNHYIEFEGACHDCGVPVKIICYINEAGSVVIEGGAMYNPLINDTKQLFLKCDNCFQKDSVLRNWRQIEVYSRVVGYIRPVSGWNKGKIEEFKQRKEFVMREEKEK